MTDPLNRTSVTPFFKVKVERKKKSTAAARDGNDAKHLTRVRALPSCISGRRPCEAHHLVGGPAAKERGVAMKATDRWAVPLTHDEHMKFHNECGSRQEREWFSARGVKDIYRLAEQLYHVRHSPARMREVIETGG